MLKKHIGLWGKQTLQSLCQHHQTSNRGKTADAWRRGRFSEPRLPAFAADAHNYKYLECRFREDNHGLKPEEIAAYKRKKAASLVRAQEVELVVLSGGSVCACQLGVMMNAGPHLPRHAAQSLDLIALYILLSRFGESARFALLIHFQPSRLAS